MSPKELEEVLRRIPRAPLAFPYGKDDFALHLLQLAAGGGRSVRELRRSSFAGLLERPKVREVLRRCGGGRVNGADFAAGGSADAAHYTLTWGQWGDTSRQEWERSYHQMARRGLNLVIQLNLPADHVRDYRRLVRPDAGHPFAFSWHPIAHGGFLTLGWARIDLDLNRREALIEEVQSDWIREAARAKAEGGRPYGVSGRPEKLAVYVDHVLAPLAECWDEAILTAAIRLLRNDLKVRDVYYYDYETSSLVKGYGSSGTGPRSLYTRLPRKFGFERRAGMPGFLERVFETRLAYLFRENGPVFWRFPPSGLEPGASQ